MGKGRSSERNLYQAGGGDAFDVIRDRGLSSQISHAGPGPWMLAKLASSARVLGAQTALSGVSNKSVDLRVLLSRQG